MSEAETSTTKAVVGTSTATAMATEKSRKPAATQRFSSGSVRHAMTHHRDHGKFVYQKLRLRHNESCIEDSTKCDKIENHEEQIGLLDFPLYVQNMFTNKAVPKSTSETVPESMDKVVPESKNKFCPDPRFWDVLKGDIIMELVKVLWDLTGKVETMSEADNTPTGKTEEYNTFGTCLIERVEKVTNRKCPCYFCQASGEPKEEWGLITASTALHVTRDGELKITGRWVRLDYEVDDDETADPEKEKSKREEDRTYLPIWKVHSQDEEGDWCAVEFITHDLNKVDTLEERINKHYELENELNKTCGQEPDDNLPVILISHPHGLAKRIIVGKMQAKSITREVRDEQDFCHFEYYAPTCPGSSGGSVYVLGKHQDGFGYWFGHSHGHSGVCEDMTCESSDGVISTWTPQ